MKTKFKEPHALRKNINLSLSEMLCNLYRDLALSYKELVANGNEDRTNPGCYNIWCSECILSKKVKNQKALDTLKAHLKVTS